MSQTDTSSSQLIWNGSYQQLLKQKSVAVTVILTEESLQISQTTLNKKTVERFRFDEIASCSVVSTDEVHQQLQKERKRSRCGLANKKSLLTQSRILEGDDVCLQLVLYPLGTKSSKKKATRRVVTLIVSSHSSHEENLSEAALFQRKVASLIHTGKWKTFLANTRKCLTIFSPTERSLCEQASAHYPQSEEWQGQDD